MAGKTKKASEATRRELINAAIELFLEKGVTRVTLEQIASAAGYTRGAIYHHFRNKSDILQELMLSVRFPLEEFLSLVDENNDSNPLELLQHRCEKAMEILFRDESRRKIHTILLHRCEFVAELNPLFRELLDHDRHLLAQSTESFERAREIKVLRPDFSPAEAGFALHSFLLGLYWSFLREPGATAQSVNIKLNIEVFFSGLRVKEVLS